MTDKSKIDSSSPRTISPRTIDHGDRPGNAWLVAAFAIAIAGVAILFPFLPHDEANRLILGILVALSTTGLIGLFLFAVGLLQWSNHDKKNDLTKNITDHYLDGLLVTRKDGHVLYANELYITLAGRPEGEQIRTIDQLFSGGPEIAEAIYRLAQSARQNKRATEELRLSPPLTGVGPVGWYRIRARPIERASGQSATLWSIADITRERERHENVFQELQHAINFLDHAPAGFFSAEPDGNISYLNATLAGWLDYDLAQVGSGGLRLADLIASDGAALLSSVHGNANEVKTEQFEVDFKQRNGRNLPVRLLHRVSFGEDRTPGPSRTLVLNRSPDKDHQDDLRAAQVRFARFFNSTPMAISTVNDRGRILVSNPAFARLMPQMMPQSSKEDGDSAVRTIYTGIGESEKETLAQHIADAIANKGDIPPLDALFKNNAGNRSVRFYVSPGDDTDGPTATVFALDTTEQRTLQENVAQAQKMNAIGELAGGVAHDFNNVLTAIIGFCDLLLAQHRPTDPSFQDIMQIKQNANRAAGLVRQLLAFSRRQTLLPEVLQMSDVLSDLQMLLRRLIGEKITIDVRHGRDLWLVKADLNQFEQVIINLVVNARDAINDKGGDGRIELRTRNISTKECAAFDERILIPGEYIAIEVEDNGKGISPEIKAKIFEPFFTTKEVGKGTGLGLSSVYGIVKQTGGFVFCTSQPGVGTTFSILLPRHLPSETEIAAKKEPVQKKPVADLTGEGAILLVEDEEAVRAFGARALSARGYTVLQASSGVDALEVVEQAKNKIDLVVSDVVMPEMDGPTLLGELRKRGIKAKVIFVSGYAEEAFSKNLPAGEDFGFLPKPFTLKQLIETVKANIPG